MAEPVTYTEEQIQAASYPDLPEKNLTTSKIPLSRMDSSHGRVYYQSNAKVEDRVYMYSSTTILSNTLAKGIGFNMWLGNATSYKDAMGYADERASVGSLVHQLCMYLIWGFTIDCSKGFLIED